MKANIKLALKGLIPAKILALIRHVIAMMTQNVALFPTPPVSMVAMTSFADDLEVAINEATKGSQQSKLHRDTLLKQAGAMLGAVADYVRQVCFGDPEKLASSGFELRKQPEKVGIPGIPTVIARWTDKSGWLIVRWPRIHGGLVYRVLQTDKDPELGASWTQVDLTTRGRYIAKGLVPAKPYWFAVITVGADGESDMSVPAMGKAI